VLPWDFSKSNNFWGRTRSLFATSGAWFFSPNLSCSGSKSRDGQFTANSQFKSGFHDTAGSYAWQRDWAARGVEESPGSPAARVAAGTRMLWDLICSSCCSKVIIACLHPSTLHSTKRMSLRLQNAVGGRRPAAGGLGCCGSACVRSACGHSRMSRCVAEPDRAILREQR